MPLIHSKSKKAFQKNVEAEIEAGKPQDQSLAIAYSIKRKKKKMAEGGILDTVVKSFTEDPYDNAVKSPDAKKRELDPNKTKQFVKGFDEDAKYAQGGMVTEASMKPRITKLSRPKIANGILSVRDRDDVNKEEHIISSMPPDGYKNQPPKEYDEEGPDRQGPSVPSLKMKRMAEGGMINKAVSMKKAQEDEVMHPEGLESDDDQMAPSEDEYMANHFAEGGMIDDEQPEPEEEDEHHDSIAAAIMSKQAKFADGGMVDIDENGEEQPNGYYARNEAALKENYDSDMDDVSQPMDSNEHGDSREDESENKRDMISQIMSKMKSRKQFR